MSPIYDFWGMSDCKPIELAFDKQVRRQLNPSSPSSLATQPSSLATHPSSLATYPSSLATHPSGLATRLSSLATILLA